MIVYLSLLEPFFNCGFARFCIVGEHRKKIILFAPSPILILVFIFLSVKIRNIGVKNVLYVSKPYGDEELYDHIRG